MPEYEFCPKCVRKTFNIETKICDYCKYSGDHIDETIPEEITLEQKYSIMKEEVVVTTTPSLDGYKVVDILDVVTAECAFGMNLFRDFFTSMTDLFGGRSSATQKVLKDARNTCLYELRKEAKEMGANAVIGVDLDYSEFSGKGKSMLFLVASGTAVKVVKQ